MVISTRLVLIVSASHSWLSKLPMVEGRLSVCLSGWLSVCLSVPGQPKNLHRGVLGHSKYQVPHSPWQANTETYRDIQGWTSSSVCIQWTPQRIYLWLHGSIQTTLNPPWGHECVVCFTHSPPYLNMTWNVRQKSQMVQSQFRNLFQSDVLLKRLNIQLL